MTVTYTANLTPNQATFSRHAKASKRVKKRIRKIAQHESMPAMDVANRILASDELLADFRLRVLTDDDLKYIDVDAVAKMVGHAVEV